MKYKPLFFTLLYWPLFIYGQQSIQGRIVDVNGYGISGAKVQVIEAQDTSSVRDGVSNFDGYYEVVSLRTQGCVLQISKQGFQTHKSLLKNDFDTLQEMPDIVLQRLVIELDELVVVGQSNSIKLSPGHVSFNLKKSSYGKSGSALDVLQKMPGVHILPNGKISLNGEEGVHLLFDGKSSFVSGESLIAYLSAIPASSLEEIELFSQPKADLDASGSSRFISIKSNSNQSEGINVVVSSNSEFGKYYRMNQNISLEANLNKWLWSSTYAYAKGKDLTEIMSSRFISTNSDLANKPLQLDMNAHRNKVYGNHYYKGQIDFMPSSTRQLGAYILINNTSRIKNELTNSSFYRDTIEPDSLLKSSNIWNHYFQNHTVGGQLFFQFKDKSNWKTYADHQVFKQNDEQQLNSEQYLDNTINYDYSKMRGHTKGKTNITSLQSNYAFKLIDYFQVNLGGRYTNIAMHTKSYVQDYTQNQWQDNLDLASKFAHKEHLKAVFIQSQFAITSNLNIDVGLRYENASHHTLITTSTNENGIIDRSYHNLFPNLSINYSLANQQQVSLYYNRRINRPSFRDLNPFVEVNDPYLYEKGNPELQPEYIQHLEFTWLFKKGYSAQLFYYRNINPISKSYLQNSEHHTVVMPLNLSNAYRLGVRFNTVNLAITRYWQLQANTNLIYKYYQWNSNIGLNENKRLTATAQLQNQIKLPLKLRFELQAMMNSMSAEGQANILPLWSVGTGVYKTLLQDKFTLYIYGSDLFRSHRPKIQLTGDFMYGQYQETYDSRVVGIRLSYRFNKGSHKHQGKQIEGNRLEENNRVNY